MIRMVLLEQCFSTQSPQTQLSPLKALDESANTRGKHVCCDTLTQQQLYQLHTIDVFVRTAIKMHLTTVKQNNLLFHVAFILLR